MSGVTRGVFDGVRRKAEAAGQNEVLTRQRVENLEAWAQAVSVTLFGRGFWGRLKWLVWGR